MSSKLLTWLGTCVCVLIGCGNAAPVPNPSSAGRTPADPEVGALGESANEGGEAGQSATWGSSSAAGTFVDAEIGGGGEVENGSKDGRVTDDSNEAGATGVWADPAGAVSVDGDERAAIAAVGDVQRLVTAVNQENSRWAADELMWLSFRPRQIVGATTGDRSLQDPLSPLDVSSGSDTCNRKGCAYTDYRLPDFNQLQLCTGAVVLSADRTTVTIDVTLNLWPYTMREETHLTASLRATSSVLDGWMRITGNAVVGMTVDSLRFNQVTLTQPPTSGSIELDRTGPLAHYRSSFTFQ